jgi:glycosyltransferase involved in cell wall biosynthesis
MDSGPESLRDSLTRGIDQRRVPQGASVPVLLLIAYDCDPRGSEPCAEWMRILEAACEFEIHAIVGPHSFAAIQEHRRQTLLPASIHVHTPELDGVWRLLVRTGQGDGLNMLAYRYWQRLASRLAVELHRDYTFSLVHQVNPANSSEPGQCWKLGVPFVWGPVSGTELLPPDFLNGLPVSRQIAERARQWGIRLSLGSRRVRRAAAHASVLLASNSGAQRDFERAFRRPVELQSGIALSTVKRPSTARFRFPGPLNLLWSGELAHPSGLPLLLEAVANLGHDVDYHLHILGTGHMQAEWKTLAAQMGVRSRCTFHTDTSKRSSSLQNRSQPDHNSLLTRLDAAHLYISTDLRNTSGAGIIQALGRGVPVMCFDQYTGADIVTRACGIKIPVSHPGHAIAAMASSIRQLAEDRTPLLRLSAAACDRAQNYLWRHDKDRILSTYRTLARVETPLRQLSGPAA